MASDGPGFPIIQFLTESRGLAAPLQVARLDLWDKAWSPFSRGTLPDDNDRLAMWIRWELADFLPVRVKILGDFAPALEAGKLVHPILAHAWSEWSKVSRRNKSNRETRPAAPLFETAVPPAQPTRPAARENNRDGPESLFSILPRVVDDSLTSGKRPAARPVRTEPTLLNLGPVRSAQSVPVDQLKIVKLTLQYLGFLESEAADLTREFAKQPSQDAERFFAKAAATIGASKSGKTQIRNRVTYTLRVDRLFQTDFDRAHAAYTAAITSRSEP